MTPADYMRFLLDWQHASGPTRLTGVDGLRVVLTQLDGFELAAGGWERHVLATRVERYEPSWLDLLCFGGEVAWARLSGARARPSGAPPRPMRATPVSIFLREHTAVWQSLAASSGPAEARLGPHAAAILEMLGSRGASFVHEIAAALDLRPDEVQGGLTELVAAGLVASDGFGGLRSMVAAKGGGFRRAAFRSRGRARVAATAGGRWSCVRATGLAADDDREALVERYAMVLLQRYGILSRRLLGREPFAVAWRELVRVYRRLEARGDIRGGRFVSGLSGEQFALPEAIEAVRHVRRTPPSGELIVLSACDPLNLAGVLTAGDRLPAVTSNRLVYRDGIAVAVRDRDGVRFLYDVDADTASRVSRLLTPIVRRTRHVGVG